MGTHDLRGSALPPPPRLRIVATVGFDVPAVDADEIIDAIRVHVAKFEAAPPWQRDGDNGRVRSRLRVNGIPRKAGLTTKSNPSRASRRRGPRAARCPQKTERVETEGVETGATLATHGVDGDEVAKEIAVTKERLARVSRARSWPTKSRKRRVWRPSRELRGDVKTGTA